MQRFSLHSLVNVSLNTSILQQQLVVAWLNCFNNQPVSQSLQFGLALRRQQTTRGTFSNVIWSFIKQMSHTRTKCNSEVRLQSWLLLTNHKFKSIFCEFIKSISTNFQKALFEVVTRKVSIFFWDLNSVSPLLTTVLSFHWASSFTGKCVI